jgi:hypothetical protein
MDDIHLAESAHGPPGDRRDQYAPTSMWRGVQQLHLEFPPAG